MPKEVVLFPNPIVDDKLLVDLWYGSRVLDVLSTAQEIGLFEYLSGQPKSIQDVAHYYRVAPRAAEAFMTVAAAAGTLVSNSLGQFGLTDISRTYLLPESPFYRRLEPTSEEMYEDLKRAFYQGDEPIKPMAVIMGNKAEDEIRDFINFLHTATLPAASKLARRKIFAHIHQLLDVGGGSGSFVSAIAYHNPNIRCTLLDLAPVCVIARENITEYGLQDRVTIIPADMFQDPWPSGHDAVFFGNIFHDWDMGSCIKLAKRAYEALEPGGYIFLHERPLNESKDGPLAVAYGSIVMLLQEKGKQYTLSEFEAILTEAGFQEFQSEPNYGYFHLVSARKPRKSHPAT